MKIIISLIILCFQLNAKDQWVGIFVNNDDKYSAYGDDACDLDEIRQALKKVGPNYIKSPSYDYTVLMHIVSEKCKKVYSHEERFKFIDELVKQGVNLDYQELGRDGSTGEFTVKENNALMWAAKELDMKMVMYLIDKGAKTNIKMDRGDTLEDAINLGLVRCSNLQEWGDNALYNKQNCDEFYQDYLVYLDKYVDNNKSKTNSNLSLIEAAKAGDYIQVKNIISSFKGTPCKIDKEGYIVGTACTLIWEKDKDLKSALYYATLYNHVKIVQYLLLNGAGFSDGELTMALIIAANNENQVMIVLLQSFFADKDEALINAAAKGLNTAVEVLIRNGANTRLSIKGITPYKAALKYGHKDTAELIKNLK